MKSLALSLLFFISLLLVTAKPTDGDKSSDHTEGQSFNLNNLLLSSNSKDPEILKTQFNAVNFNSVDNLGKLSKTLKSLINSGQYHYYNKNQVKLFSDLIMELILNKEDRIRSTQDPIEWQKWSNICKLIMEILILTDSQDRFNDFFGGLKSLDLLDLRLQDPSLRIGENLLPTGSLLNALALKGYTDELQKVLQHYLERISSPYEIFFFNNHLEDLYKEMKFQLTIRDTDTSSIKSQLKEFVKNIVNHIESNKDMISQVIFKERLEKEILRWGHLIRSPH